MWFFCVVVLVLAIAVLLRFVLHAHVIGALVVFDILVVSVGWGYVAPCFFAAYLGLLSACFELAGDVPLDAVAGEF